MLSSNNVIVPTLGLTQAQADARYVRPAVSGPAPSTLLQNGYAFPAVQVPSVDPNMLDDYEEGTWTPTITAPGVLTVDSARYVKIGKLVTCSFTAYVDAVASAVSFRISGLPFAVGGVNENIGGSIAFLPGAGSVPTCAFFLASPTAFFLLQNNGSPINLTQVSDTTMYASFSYQVN